MCCMRIADLLFLVHSRGLLFAVARKYLDPDLSDPEQEHVLIHIILLINSYPHSNISTMPIFTLKICENRLTSSLWC